MSITTLPQAQPPLPAAAASRRIGAIDTLRGLVMLLMLVDHARETVYLHRQVGDPMDVQATDPALFFTRLAAHLCAPAFVLLTGLSAWLYAHPADGPPRSAAGFLFMRGLLLLALEVTLVSFAWVGDWPMKTVYLQVIWAIGLSMLALSALAALPLPWLAVLGGAIVLGHNLLTPIGFQPGETGYAPWTVLHDRGWLINDGPLRVKVSYPVLPWIGVILLGYAAGPLFGPGMLARQRRQWLLQAGLGCLLLLAVLRGFNLYGETLPWVATGDGLRTVMSWLNFTKYPPSLHFLLLTLGLTLLLLRAFEARPDMPARPGQAARAHGVTNVLRHFGGAPMFFYLLHLYALLAWQKLAVALWGANHAQRFGVDHVASVWATAAVLALLLYWPCRAFAQYKRRSRQAWLRYL